MKQLRAAFSGWRRSQKIFFWMAVAILFYTLFGFLAAPAIVKTVLEKKLPETLNRQVAIEKIRINPYALTASIEGLRVADKEGEGDFVSFHRFFIDLAGASIFKRGVIVKSVSLSAPSVHFSRLDDGSFSFSDLLGETPEGSSSLEKADPFLFSINNVEIVDGTLSFLDKPKNVRHVVENLNLAIPSLSNLPSDVELYVEPAFSAVVNGTPISLDGGTKPFVDSLDTEMALRIDGIEISHYLAYIPNPSELTLAAALLDVDTQLTYRAEPTTYLSLEGTVGLREVDVVDGEGRSYLKVPQLTLVLGDSDLLAGEIRLVEIAIEAPQVELVRLADERVQPFALLATAADAEKGAAPVEVEEAPMEPLRLSIERLRLNGGALHFEDQALEKPATLSISELMLVIENLSTITGTTADLDFSLALNRSGRAAGEGTLVLDPLQVNVDLDISALALEQLQSYISEYTHILLDGGAFSLQGALAFIGAGEDDSEFRFEGQSAIEGLRTIEAQSGEDLVQWSALRASRIDFASHPWALTIEEIRLDDFFGNLLIREDGTPNLAALVKTEAPVDADAAHLGEVGMEPSPARDIRIAKVSLQNARLAFQDRSVQPAYAVNLEQLSGSLSGLSSRPGDHASMQFDARIEQAPVVISGTTNVLSDELFVDLDVDFKGFNLSPLSPYSGKYIGRKIERGMLHLGLHYRIRDTRLESTHKVLLDQFSLGERVESPDAAALPVGLAVALLKNRRGEIHLDIPVTGELDDPEFRVGRVVVQILVNLISRAATSPFSLLAGLIPEGKDLQYIHFEAGSADLTEDAQENLEILTDVLYDRPSVRLDIAGRADLEHDRRALAEKSLNRLIRLEKLRKTSARKGEESGVAEVVVTAEEYPAYLKAAYERVLETVGEAEKAEVRDVKPDDAADETDRMEAFMLDHVRIEDEDLRLLALARANAVLARLTASEKVEAGRLFVIEPRLATTGTEEEQEPQTLVELLIK